MKIRSYIFYILLSSIVFLSFFLYSSRHYPLLNSDDALNILMTHYYMLPNDLYCWGQDRGGTLIPFVSQMFYKGLGLSAVNSVSLSNYIILILGYIGFSSLFKNKRTKILFALVWFFPSLRFIDLTRYPIGVQYSLIGFSIFLIDKINFKKKSTVKNHTLSVIVVLSLFLSIWVSDLAIVSIFLLIVTLTISHFHKNQYFRIPKPAIFYFFTGVVVTYIFIRYAKTSVSGKTENYIAFNNWETFLQGLEIFTNVFIKILLFQTNELVYSIYAWLVIICIAFFLFIYRSKLIHIDYTRKWLSFFFLDFVVIAGVLFLSKWVFLNNMGRWYFVASYISLSMVLLILFDNTNLPVEGKKRVFNYLFFFTIIIGSLSTVHYLKYVRPKTLKSKIEERSEFLTLGEIGIIGEFWNSYISACPDPSRIKVTAHDKSVVRNYELVDEVFAQPKLFVIKDMWMESFPDTLYQFGRTLVKKGDSINIADCVVNEYVEIK